MTIEYKSFEIKEPKVEQREFTAIISTSDMDLDNEVLLPTGANMKEFKGNPILLFNHDKNMPIGKALSVRKSGNGLKATAKLAEGIDTVDNIWKLIKQGILKGISVGFLVEERRAPTSDDLKMFGKNVRSVISKWKLLEFSVVSVPCNSAALITGCKKYGIDPKEILGEAFEQEKSIEEQVEKEIKDLEIDIADDTKEKLIETVKERQVSVKEIMTYFKDELVKEIKKNKGQLF
jgi:HK97 family phage prohead protease